MIVYSHRRSGTHLLIEHIYHCFGIKPKKFHLEPNEKQKNNNRVIYIVRDGRDVLNSCFHWWNDSGESRVCFIKDTFNQLSFSQYLRGVEIPTYREKRDFVGQPTNVHPIEMQTGLFRDPIQYWIDHITHGIYVKQYPWVRFENLVNNPERVMHVLSDVLNLKMARPPHRIDKLVGFHPRKGKIGDHKNLFTQDDLDYFEQRAGDLMTKLGYES